MTKLEKLREIIKSEGLDGYLLFHMDAHQSEYLAPCDERIGYISGFTGSNGLCLVTQDHAFMWTDGRYYLAAQQQLEAGWEMKKLERGEKMYFEWIKENMPKGSRVGVDESQMPAGSFKLRSEYLEKEGITLVPGKNLVDQVWGEDKPPMPTEKVWILEEKYTGQST
jgi:Xaa-Pro aminopeptidase